MGLREISSSAISSGATSAISIKTGIDPSETGIASLIVNQLSSLADPKMHETFLLVSIVLGILSILLIVFFVIQIISSGKIGIITAILGFLGPMIVLLSPVTNILLIIIGAIMVLGSVYIAKNYRDNF
ncbi:MAG TPA: hypothetical protein VJR22_08315 [Candidatus Nitrosotalea sp.]|nr:hypothetical protein [Candidatus Nitrosotalea sp.]